MQFINRLDAHHKLLISVAVATIVALLVRRLSDPVVIMVTWLAYCGMSLTLSWITILTSHPADLKKEAYAQDSNRTLIFLFTVVASVVSLFAILILLKGTGGNDGPSAKAHIILSVASVVAAWWQVHTIFTLRYAHLYYYDTDDNKKGKPSAGGLDFPHEDHPDYLDFAYFSFVLGMTFQVSDVTISSKRIRRLALVHGLLSFAFNTVIVALSINVVAGMIQK